MSRGHPKHDRVPDWYAEIFPAGPRDGFYHKMGDHAASFVDRGRGRLIVSFDNLSDAGYPHYDIAPWAAKFVSDRGWSHLGLYARGPTWFRAAAVNRFFDRLAREGFFARFDHVAFTGTSMGGFAALAYCGHAPGATVMALSPQSTLDLARVPWERRFGKAQAQDWSLPFSDAAETVAAAGRVYVVHDPFLAPDRAHAERLPGATLLRAFGCGHKSAVALRRMGVLKAVMEGALTGRLTEAEFYRLIRKRRDLVIWRKEMEAHLAARGREDRQAALTAAFRRRRRAREAGLAP